MLPLLFKRVSTITGGTFPSSFAASPHVPLPGLPADKEGGAKNRPGVLSSGFRRPGRRLCPGVSARPHVSLLDADAPQLYLAFPAVFYRNLLRGLRSVRPEQFRLAKGGFPSFLPAAPPPLRSIQPPGPRPTPICSIFLPTIRRCSPFSARSPKPWESFPES